MDEASKNYIIERIEYILSYLLSRKHDSDITISFKKVGENDGNNRKTDNIRKEQVLDR